MRLSSIRKQRLALVPFIFCAFVLAACGSSSDSSGTSGASGSSIAQVDEAKSLVKKYTAPATDVGVTEPISAAIPTGKKIDFMMCGAPACQTFVEPLKAAAAALGWEVKVITAGPTPDKTTAGWNLAVQEKPDAVVSSAFPKAAWSSQLKKLKDLGIPVVECCTTDDAGDGILFVDTGKETGRAGGKMQADWVVADTEGKANAVYLNVPAYTILGYQQKGFTEEYKRLCPKCTMDTLDLNVADLGTPKVTTAIVGYLQSHPDVNYLAAGTDDALVGLPAALSAAGMADRVKAIGLSPSTVNLNYIAAGKNQVATIGFPHSEIAWKMMDVLARQFTDSSLDADEPMIPRTILTKDTIEDPDTLTPTVANYEDLFKKLWNK